ncbi:MAG: 3-dehydroquinate synthase [Candidatus Zambryskibacteria bacterium RIFCSPHIGHO2_12_FULL_38_34]|uniref:3-dehydroquinate synthase n=1 Tax=Candidatus Zambryskibacteria bacterium RIFCSPLOWO2_12_FULL_39_16 TaxID=1802775 RepID=A0A1G2UQZ1_9BACT|nr:MAG: 3-dehydroquinate synthase [Candidatus Zambryskibacteria bacterium RIFCSPHIGHO2_02_FULL_38_22]OHA97324.1 MAG: 3-dehydroquinate synthase [Candidatus Zambryskibacteria bacterium RIFCSPHIGHO2_12_FULL_38_34]OHB08232.1 MAG: 3-dehydroquinate synthase [Candidatus Zambryskibacteria bacterium RIFCSPLOWO2_02_FULL_38_13]OHB11774.1 MAG: 3-dehydroquinate synthase [Candidatus Zambryskibacteria bacterium RIFCSPLOWO2_12_FULL_39_16]
MKNGTIYKTYKVELDDSRYNILVGRNLLSESLVENLNNKTKNKKVVLIFDPFFKDKVYGKICPTLKDSGYEVYTYALKSGKHNKTINKVVDIYTLLEKKNLSRDSTIVAIGGGVIGDLTGFVASTYLRGINFIQVPTTIMGMIDSSIGGKVAVNFGKTINAIGNYYHPILNIIDLELLESLSERNYISGLAEIIKCAIISDRELFEYLDSNSQAICNRKQDELLHIMCRTVEIKLEHVSGDTREQDKRLKLNYGHTMGHSIEISTDVSKEVYRHGEGVSLGMVGAAFLAERYFPKKNNVLKKHEAILAKYGLPIKVDSKKIGFKRDRLIKECLENILKDKKRKDNRLRFVLAEKIGLSGVYSNMPDSYIIEAFNYLIT